jgi:transposase-like protein
MEVSHAAFFQADDLGPAEAAERVVGPSDDVRRHAVGNAMGHRRLWSTEHRVEIVLQSLKGQEPNTRICRRYHISEPTLYKWRNLFLQGGRVFLGSLAAPNVKALIEENQALKQMVADLSMAYRRLRAARSRPTAGSRPRNTAAPRQPETPRPR